MSAVPLEEALWQAIAGVRDNAPRIPNDADTWAIVEAVLHVLYARGFDLGGDA